MHNDEVVVHSGRAGNARCATRMMYRSSAA
jgi:hypothetical protein